MKKIFKATTAILLGTVLLCSFQGNSMAMRRTLTDRDFEDVELSQAEGDVEGYLLSAGYPLSFIRDIDETQKRDLFENKCTFESQEITYGIFTEDYNISYRLSDNGNVIMDEANKAAYHELLRNRDLVNKIIADKAESMQMAKNTVSAAEINRMPENASILSLSNWTASITVSHTSYSNNISKKKLTYNWKWSYAPIWTLTDKVAVAWSGDFTAEPSTIYWTYKKNVGFTGSQLHMDYIDESGYGYDDYDCNAGCAKGIDIRGTIAGTYNRYHKGSLSLTLTKNTSTNTRESAIGRYYHKEITPKLSLSFSKSGPSISVSSGSMYDQSSDSAVAFWATSK